MGRCYIIAIGVALPFLLTGCLSPAQRAAKAAAYQRAINAQDDGQCRAYGATPGTQLYYNCRMTLAQNRNASEEAQKARLLQVFEGMQAYAAQREAAQAQSLARMQQIPAPTNCTTSYIGNQAYTHCN